MIIYLMGVTCSGKTTLVDDFLSDPFGNVGAVQVGKEMRRRYPPEYFQGSGAPGHTEDEARRIFEEQLKAAEGKKLILVDGQPRRRSQVALMKRNPGLGLILDVSEETQRERLENRFKNDPAGRFLAEDRIKNDKVMYYDCICEMYHQGCPYNILPHNTLQDVIDVHNFLKGILLYG